MKTLYIYFLVISFAGNALSQGWFGEFALRNFVPVLGVDAPVFDTDCKTRLQGSAFLSEVYAGLSPDGLSAVGGTLPFLTGPGAGYMQQASGGLLPVTQEGQIVYAQLRAWQASAGSSYEAAVAAGGKYGFGNIVPTATSIPPGPPPFAVGLESFCLMPPLGEQPRLQVSVIAQQRQIVVEVVGMPSQIAVLQVSTNLVSWAPVATNALSNTLWIYQDTPPAADRRFYRAVLQQSQ